MGIRLAKYFRQEVLCWERTGTNTAGKPVYAVNPVALMVRWDDEMSEVIDAFKRTVTSRACLMCASEIKYQSVVFRGTLEDWQAMASYPKVPTPSQGGFEVILTSHTPSRRGANLLYRAWL